MISWQLFRLYTSQVGSRNAFHAPLTHNICLSEELQTLYSYYSNTNVNYGSLHQAAFAAALVGQWGFIKCIPIYSAW